MTISGLRGRLDEGRLLDYPRENLPGLGEETLADFLAKNRERHPVEPDLDPEWQMVCLDDEVFRRVFSDGEGWGRFRREFPRSDGTLQFSPGPGSTGA